MKDSYTLSQKTCKENKTKTQDTPRYLHTNVACMYIIIYKIKEERRLKIHLYCLFLLSARAHILTHLLKLLRYIL